MPASDAARTRPGPARRRGASTEKGYLWRAPESLPSADSNVMARPKLSDDVSGVDALRRAERSMVRESDDRRLLKTAPAARRRSSSRAERAADARVGGPRQTRRAWMLYYHGVALDMAPPPGRLPTRRCSSGVGLSLCSSFLLIAGWGKGTTSRGKLAVRHAQAAALLRRWHSLHSCN